MKIGIDAHMVGRRATGNETYVTNLARALALVDDGRNHYTLYIDRQAAAGPRVVADPRFLQRPLRPHTPFVRIPVSLPLELARRPLDVLHLQYNLPPLLPRCGRVLTVHDISYEHFPECFTLRERVRNKVLVRWSARRAEVVIAVSEYTKRDLVETYGIDPERIVVTLEAADPAFRPPQNIEETEQVCRRYGIEGPYVLYVGNIQPRKNLPRLIQAYAQLMAAGDIQHRLVIVGRKAWLHSEVFQEARRSGLSNQIVFTDYVPQSDLPHLYARADVFVFPSLFEGFGLPVLEAMACGAPVITSRSSSLPEVAGDAACYVDPFSAGEIARALRQLVCDAELRARLAGAGLEQAARFSWEQTARQTLRAYEQAFRAVRGAQDAARPLPRETITRVRR